VVSRKAKMCNGRALKPAEIIAYLDSIPEDESEGDIEENEFDSGKEFVPHTFSASSPHLKTKWHAQRRN